MDDVTSVSNSTSNSNMMYILDGLNVLSGFGPDILQQALEEVTCDVDVPITTSPETLHHHDVVQTLDMDISRLLNSPITTTSVGSIRHESGDRLLDQIAGIERSLPSPTSKQPVQHQQQSLGVKNGLLSTTQLSKPNNSNSGLMTVYNPGDGTLSLSLETARSLGIEVGGGSIVQQVSKSPQTISAPSSVVVNSSSFIPSSISDGGITYILTSAPAVTWAQTSVLKPVSSQLPLMQHHPAGQLKPAVNVVRPTVVGNGITVHMNNSSVLTSVLRPVMTTGIANSGYQQRHQPILLPKLPSNIQQQQQQQLRGAAVGSAAGQKQAFIRQQAVVKSNVVANPMQTKFVITSSASSISGKKTNPSPIGTSQNPIQLIQEGSTLRSLHPLTNTQVTQIAKALKEKTQKDVPSAVVCENGPNSTRIVYKIVYPEDVLPPLPPAKRTALSGDTSDEDSYGECESPPQNPMEMVYTPEELVRMHHLPPAGRSQVYKGRKRGRPRGDEAVLSAIKAAEDHAKKLRTEFGLTGAQAIKLEKDIVDDRLVKLSNRHDDDTDEIDESDDADKVLSVSRTRSGRMSRPPTQMDDDDYQYRMTSSNPQLPPPPPTLNTCDVIKVPTTEESPSLLQQPQPLKPKRKLSVPPRYRCRVCHKTYLGDRKMSRHVKLFPNHGPCEEPSHPVSSLKEENNKKMAAAALSSMPIIPLARTQLEDLVKNLDAELVLDVVSKKMFDNFSMWQLQMKKMSISKDKGLKVIDRLFRDTENVLSEMKKLIDNCLTDTKLCDDPCPSIAMGEFVQLAMSGHDGPWYLEKTNHIPEMYHKPLGLEPLVVSPRSESNDVTSVILHPDDDNSNSMMSGTSEPPRQMVLKMEKNLGARSRLEDMDDDTQDFGSPTKKREFGDNKVEDTLSPASQDEEEDEDDVCDDQNKTSPERDSSTSNKNVTTDALRSELAMEIDSLNNMTRQHCGDNSENDLFLRTRLPSFSSIIGNAASSEMIATTTCSSDASLLSVLHSTSASDLVMNGSGSHDHLLLNESDHHHLGSRHDDDRDGGSDAAIHSRRSSIDAGGLIIHESLPGSRHNSPSVSRRTSIDHGSLLQHLNDRRSSVDQSLLSGSGLCLLPDNQPSDVGLPELSHHLSIPFMSHHDPSDSCRMTGSDPPTPANGLHPLCSMMDQSMSRHYHSMPNSPRPNHVTSISALASLASCVEKATSTSNSSISVTEEDLMSLSIKPGGIMDQLTIHADMDTSTNVTFSGDHPILSLSPVKQSSESLPEIDKRPETPPTTSSMVCSLPPPPTHSGVSQDSSSSTSHFLSDLESVLGDSADFSFASSLKTPEKLFHSIPPMMTMIHHHNIGKKNSASHVSTSSVVSSAPVRIDFLGAIEKNDLNNLSEEKSMRGFGESSRHSSSLQSSSSHFVTPERHSPSHFVTPERDSLSRLFDEDHHVVGSSGENNQNCLSNSPSQM